MLLTRNLFPVVPRRPNRDWSRLFRSGRDSLSRASSKRHIKLGNLGKSPPSSHAASFPSSMSIMLREKEELERFFSDPGSSRWDRGQVWDEDDLREEEVREIIRIMAEGTSDSRDGPVHFVSRLENSITKSLAET